MKISVNLENSYQQHKVLLHTNDQVQELTIPAKDVGYGSSVNGGELLLLAIATCFCNDLYREAMKENIKITYVSVNASAEFSEEGAAGYNITYNAKVEGDASGQTLAMLMKRTDQVTEIQNTLRAGVNVTFTEQAGDNMLVSQ